MDQATTIVLLMGAAAIGIAGRRISRRRPGRRPPRRTGTAGPARAYPGDYEGRVAATYAARLDGKASPGEIVWTWVPYEDDVTKGKDRPVLIIGRDRSWLLALMLTSKDHDKDAADEARYGRRWMDIGAGPWDSQRRPSEVRLDRVIRVHPQDVRREAAVIDRRVFDDVVRSL